MLNTPIPTTREPIEVGISAFVAERYRELGIAADPAELFSEADDLRSRIARHRGRARTAVPVGVIILVAALGGLINALSSSSTTPVAVVVVAPFVAIAWYLLDYGFRSEDRQRFGTRRHGGQQFDIAGSDRFSQVFKPVQDGTCQLAKISASGTSSGFTPVSNRPIEKYMVRHAFDDAWLPADLLHEPQPADSGEPISPEHVVIHWRDVPPTPIPQNGTWKQYYLWRLLPAVAGALFDRAVTIYHGKPTERIKARIAIVMVCEHFADCRKLGVKTTSQNKLSLMLAERLKLDAKNLLAAGKITPLEAQKLERINISGERKSIDPTVSRTGLGDKPDSWFFQLLSGDNKTILPFIRTEAVKDQPDLPMFHDD